MNSSELTQTVISARVHLEHKQTSIPVNQRLVIAHVNHPPPPKDDDSVKVMPREWTTYRTRFLIRATQLDQPFTFVDCLGREHSGAAGDYLVLSSDGSRRIAPREIFEDIYVPIDQPPDPCPMAIQLGSLLPSEFLGGGFGNASELAGANSQTQPVSPPTVHSQKRPGVEQRSGHASHEAASSRGSLRSST